MAEIPEDIVVRVRMTWPSFLQGQFDKQFDKLVMMGGILLSALALLWLYARPPAPEHHDLLTTLITVFHDLIVGLFGALLREMVGHWGRDRQPSDSLKGEK